MVFLSFPKIVSTSLLGGGGGITRPLPRDGGVMVHHGDQVVGQSPGSGPQIENGERGAEDGSPSCVRGKAVKNEMINILGFKTTGVALRSSGPA